LKGHTKGIRHIAYSDHFKYLLSCSFEFEVYVWNLYLNYPIYKLKHDSSLVSCLTLKDLYKRIAITMDVKVNLKLWNLNTFENI